VALNNQWQACLFLHELQEGDIEIGSSSDTNHPRLSPLAQHVRSLLLKDWSVHNPPSMERGGGSLICEIIRSCPSLENFAMVNSLNGRCKDPIMSALASRKRIKDFVILKDSYGHPSNQIIMWLADEVVARLFAKWEYLEIFESHKLSGRPIEMIETIHKSIPVIVNCALRTIILTESDLDEREFALILQSSRESLRTLEIVDPTPKLDRPGLCRILKECTGPGLESLTLTTLPNWHIIRSSVNDELSDDPAKNRNLLEIVFKSSSALKNLKSLSIHGRLTGSELFIFLPPSIVKLSWGKCHLTAAAFAKALSSFIQYPPELHALKLDHTDVLNKRVQWLPKLKCCTVIDDHDCQFLVSFY
jgi:hypothetical protein